MNLSHNWNPITHCVDYLRSCWSLIEVDETSAKWANRYNGFAVINDYDDRKGYQLFICDDPDSGRATSAQGVQNLATALGAIYSYTELDRLATVEDDELQVTVEKPTIGNVDANERGTTEFDLQDVCTPEELIGVFPDSEDEIMDVVDSMGDSSSQDRRGGSGGGDGPGTDGSSPKHKQIA